MHIFIGKTILLNNKENIKVKEMKRKRRINVRKHTRRLKSGGKVKVKQHYRNLNQPKIFDSENFTFEPRRMKEADELLNTSQENIDEHWKQFHIFSSSFKSAEEIFKIDNDDRGRDDIIKEYKEWLDFLDISSILTESAIKLNYNYYDYLTEDQKEKLDKQKESLSQFRKEFKKEQLRIENL